MIFHDSVPIRASEPQQPAMQRGSADAMYHEFPSASDLARVAELEKENNRLQLLVAELLIKNQQLRKI